MTSEHYFYLSLFVVFFGVTGSIFFASWWNRRHGLDEEGNPIEPRNRSKP